MQRGRTAATEQGKKLPNRPMRRVAPSHHQVGGPEGCNGGTARRHPSGFEFSQDWQGDSLASFETSMTPNTNIAFPQCHGFAASPGIDIMRMLIEHCFSYSFLRELAYPDMP